jgi:glutamyl-tRNA reductase
MAQYRYIIDKYIKKFIKWQTLNELSPEIQRIKNYGEEICEKRIKTFKNKRYTKDNEILARIMIQSTAKVYINRAIKLLKKEKLNGTEDNCLRFIDEIFCSNEK